MGKLGLGLGFRLGVDVFCRIVVDKLLKLGPTRKHDGDAYSPEKTGSDQRRQAKRKEDKTKP